MLGGIRKNRQTVEGKDSMGGQLIVFEGVEGAGKTTQIERSRAWLRQHLPPEIPILATREPGGTALGTGIRRLLLEEKQQQAQPNPSVAATPLSDTLQSPHNRTELLLYAADRAQHVEEFLKPALDRGAIILCDRYTDSTIAYQGYGRGLDLELIHQLNQIATGGLQSDLTLWLDVNVEIGLKRARQRGTSDRMEAAELTFHERVYRGFVELAEAHRDRIVRVDANQNERSVAREIEQLLAERMGLFKGVQEFCP